MTWSVMISINAPRLDLSASLRSSTRTPLVAAGATSTGVSLFRMSSSPLRFASLSVSASASDDNHLPIICKKEVVSTDKAPPAVGPYSQAIKANGFVFVSGVLGLVPEVSFTLESLFRTTLKIRLTRMSSSPLRFASLSVSASASDDNHLPIICKKEVVSTDKAPPAVGPYSQAIKANGFVFVSGVLGLVPETGEFISDDVEDQTYQVK
ncbi:hypothetical protein F2Q69_00037793 [Brassica cretica]|uniref:Uncharacterized protein n=1 Tax=Brassica cretica TaxID=69181 RepID=A0A8S9SG72_BRACR|nr:hypothetical protein F2Q69_00037793 [Brassica cretica]